MEDYEPLLVFFSYYRVFDLDFDRLFERDLDLELAVDLEVVVLSSLIPNSQSCQPKNKAALSHAAKSA